MAARSKVYRSPSRPNDTVGPGEMVCNTTGQGLDAGLELSHRTQLTT